MRFLGVGETNDLASMYAALVRRGHEVRVHVSDPASRDVHGGMLDFTGDWAGELGWLREAGDDGIALFETANLGAVQDELRRDGFHVVGGSAWGDRLEGDRGFGQDVLRSIGLPVAPHHRFSSFEEARAFLRQSPGRYVLKFNGASNPRTRNFIGQMDDACDMRALLSVYEKRTPAGQAVDFVLMEHLQGVEVGVGAYFNGQEFLRAACIDFEHKRFFPGELGELTGEMGTIVSYRGSGPLFRKVLAPLREQLREGAYCGYINVNLIANADGLWPLEFTSRFGYPGYAICEALHLQPWERIFSRMVRQDSLAMETQGGFAAGVVLSVPPFPYPHGYAELSKGMPVCLRPDMPAADREALHLCEVAVEDGQLVTSGTCGHVGVATGTGDTIAQANAQALRVAAAVAVPNLRYRRDIGERVDTDALRHLAAWGLYEP